MEAFFYDDPKIQESIDQIIEKLFTVCLLSGQDSETEYQRGLKAVEQIASTLISISSIPSSNIKEGVFQLVEQRLPDKRVIENFPMFYDVMNRMIMDGIKTTLLPKNSEEIIYESSIKLGQRENESQFLVNHKLEENKSDAGVNYVNISQYQSQQIQNNLRQPEKISSSEIPVFASINVQEEESSTVLSKDEINGNMFTNIIAEELDIEANAMSIYDDNKFKESNITDSANDILMEEENIKQESMDSSEFFKDNKKLTGEELNVRDSLIIKAREGLGVIGTEAETLNTEISGVTDREKSEIEISESSNTEISEVLETKKIKAVEIELDAIDKDNMTNKITESSKSMSINESLIETKDLFINVEESLNKKSETIKNKEDYLNKINKNNNNEGSQKNRLQKKTQIPQEAMQLQFVLNQIFPKNSFRWNLKLGEYSFLAQVEDLLIYIDQNKEGSLIREKMKKEGWKTVILSSSDLAFPRRMLREIKRTYKGQIL